MNNLAFDAYNTLGNRRLWHGGATNPAIIRNAIQ